jgi:hypothetical protein
MSFIKKNYEKVLLGAVLLGLVGTLLFLPVMITADQNKAQAMRDSLIHPPPKPLPALDMSHETNVLNQVELPFEIDFETTNRLFNPMEWRKTPDGRLFPIKTGSDDGPGAIKVTRLIPLYFVLKLDSVEPANQFSPARYVISVQRQNAAMPSQRNAHPHYISIGEKNEAFSLVSVTGPANDPQLAVQVADTGETVNLSKSKPYQRVSGYAADLAYPLLGKKWNDQRLDSNLKIDTGDYIVVVIDANEVVISAESNQKKTTLPYQP